MSPDIALKSTFLFVLELTPMGIARKNAEIVFNYSTAYPFKLPENKVVCVYCDEGFEDPTLFRIHMRSEHREFKSHIAFAHISEGYVKADCTELTCNICKDSFAELKLLSIHLRSFHKLSLNLDHDIGMQPFKFQKGKFPCALCDANFLQLRNLSRHTQTHFAKFTCESCGVSYSTLTSLQGHIKRKHGRKRLWCKRCRQIFDSTDQLSSHMKNSSTCGSYLCNICGDRFYTWLRKQAHMVKQHGEPVKEYPCVECGSMFGSQVTLKAHFTIAHTDNYFKCTYCDRKFHTESKLKEHKAVHTGEKRFECKVCSKAFPRKYTMLQHMWIHSEVKKHVCSVCSKAFNQKVTLRKHMESIHPEIDSN